MSKASHHVLRTPSQAGLDQPLEERILSTHKMADRKWRLNNLYHILNEQMQPVRFEMRPLQEHMYDRWWWRNLILKSRQVGATTMIELTGLDATIFFKNYRVVVISHKKESAADILESKALFPYMNLHPELRERVKLVEQNKTTLKFSNGSSIEVTNSGRSGTGNFLHISEFGHIAAKRPDVAREIIAGTLPGFHQGALVFVESTAEGNGGQFRDMCDTAQNLQLQGKQLTEMDFKFHFYGWADRPENRLGEEEAEHVDIPPRLQAYFDELREKDGIATDTQQQAWYTVQERTLQQDMKKEQPATPKEAFESSGKGKILDLQMSQMREDGRITEVAPIQGRPIYTFWDIGLNDDTAVIFMQNVGNTWNTVGSLAGSDDGLIEWVRRVRELGVDRRWNIVAWVGPHDLKKRSASSGESTWDEVKKETGIAFTVVPRVSAKKVSIDKLRGFMSLLRIDEEQNEELIKALDQYRWSYDEVRAVYKDKPHHGPESNYADALQSWALWLGKENHNQELLAMGREERPRQQQQNFNQIGADGAPMPQRRRGGMAGFL